VDITAIQPVRLQEIVAIPDATRRQGFAVAANQTLDGQVVSVQGDTVIVAIGRQQVPAQAAPGTTLQAGEAVRLFVRDADSDRVVMQIVARGASLQTLRSLTTQDLSAELTGLGVAPDETAIAVARALINRGQPVTAQNVLDVRSALARLGASGQQDLEAAVFLKGQRLPITADALQIVRQALQSRSALGAQVEGLRNALADLAARLTELGVTPSPELPTAAAAPAGPAAAAATAEPPEAAPGTAPQPPDLAEPAANAAEAPTAGRAGPPTPGTAAPVGRAAQEATPPAEPAPDAAVSQPGPAGEPAGPAQPTPARAAATPADALPEVSGPPERATAGQMVAPTAAELGEPVAPASPLPLAEGQGEGVPAGGAVQGAPAGGAGGASASVPAGEKATPPLGTPSPQPSPTGRGSTPEPSLPRLLSVVAETLDRLPLLDDRAVDEGPDGLASQIRRVIADQGTPVEAKLARVLEGLVNRSDLDRLLAGDLKTTLHALVRETHAHLDAGAADRLPTEALRDLRTTGQQAEALLGQVELQQLANAAPRPDGQAPTYLVLQLPLPGGRESQTAQIRIRQESDGKTARIDPKNVHVVFQFELQHLRTIRVGIRVVDRRMSCQIGSSDPAVTELLAQRADELRSGLTGLGYAVDPVKTAVLTAADLAPPPSAETPVARPPRTTMRLDARA
jgi:hypothetical protein